MFSHHSAIIGGDTLDCPSTLLQTADCFSLLLCWLHILYRPCIAYRSINSRKCKPILMLTADFKRGPYFGAVWVLWFNVQHSLSIRRVRVLSLLGYTGQTAVKAYQVLHDTNNHPNSPDTTFICRVYHLQRSQVHPFTQQGRARARPRVLETRKIYQSRTRYVVLLLCTGV